MIKYLDMENASIIIDLLTLNETCQFLEQNNDDIKMLNFKRVIINLKAKYINQFIKNCVLSKELIYIVNTYIESQVISYKLPDNMLIVNHNVNNLVLHDSIYNQIDLNECNFDKILDAYSKTDNIIINCMPNVDNIAEFNTILTKLFKSLPNKYLSLEGFVLPTSLIREHPCNFYLCDGWKCKKQISQLPKQLIIDNKYEIRPHGVVNEKYSIGNVKNRKISQVLEEYKESSNFINFQNLCKRTFIKYIPHYPFDYFPLNSYLHKEVEND